jgi:hypothetical protein
VPQKQAPAADAKSADAKPTEPYTTTGNFCVGVDVADSITDGQAMNSANALIDVCERFCRLKIMSTIGVQWAAARDAERRGWHTELYRDADYMVDYLRHRQIEATIKARQAPTRSNHLAT